MQSKIRSQPWWFLPAIALLIGLLIGWLVIGWGVWPVTYKNSLPPDLRATERQDYLLMTAESFAGSGDLNAAVARLGNWPPAQLATDFDDLQTRLEGADPLRASQVQLLRGAIEASTPALLGGEVADQPAAEQAPEPGASTSRPDAFTAVLYLLLVLGGAVAIYFLLRRWRLANQETLVEEAEPLPGAVSTVGRPGQSAFPELDERYAPVVAVAAAPWESGEDEAGEPGEVAEEDETTSGEPAAAAPDGPGAPSGDAEGTVRRFARPAAVAAVATTAAKTDSTVAAAGLSKLGDYQSFYQMGESDYDEAFDIHDAGGVYVGQCGVELVDPIGRTHDQAAALQVWLWDTNDPDTKVKVLMSEGAYRDASLRSQLAGEHQVLPVRLGTEFELVSYNLLLKGVVERIDYAEQEPVGGVFAELGLRLTAYQRSR